MLFRSSTSDLSEGTNLYYTDARVDSRYASLIVHDTGASLDLSQKSTTDLVEGTNLYYTDARADARVAAAASNYATAAQGALADTALQSETIDLTTLKAEVAASTSFSDFKTRIAAL